MLYTVSKSTHVIMIVVRFIYSNPEDMNIIIDYIDIQLFRVFRIIHNS